jgi:hypothetical protein
MKTKYVILISVAIIAVINLTILINWNEANQLNLSSLKNANATWLESIQGKADQACWPCAQPGTARYACRYGSSTCFLAVDCIGGIC